MRCSEGPVGEIRRAFVSSVRWKGRDNMNGKRVDHRRGPRRAERWTSHGEFHKALMFDGKCVLSLHEGAQINQENMYKLLRLLNDLGVDFTKA